MEASIETLRNYIDWTPFFMTRSLAGKYPRILEDEVVGEEAQRLFKDANELLDKLSAEKTLNPRGVVGLFPANRVGDDIEIYRDETRTHVLTVSHHLRQQTEKVGFANYCLADFVAPKLSGKADYIGAFAVTGGTEEDALADAYEAQHDDYNKIMIKAIADRPRRPLPSICMRKCARFTGDMRPMRTSAMRSLFARTTRSDRRRDIRPVRSTPKRGPSGSYWTSKPIPA